MFDSIYSIALDILNNVGGDATRFFDSNFEIALAILGAIGGDDTQEFDSVYSILEEIYKVRFGSVLVDPDSVYAIADAINHAINDSDSTKYDSTYSILLHIDQNPLAGHKFSIITDETNVVIINGRRTREVYLDEGEEVEWSVSKEGYVTQSGTYTMTDEDYSIEVTLVILQYTVTISATPVDATIVINGEERDTLTADYGTTITYSVSAEHYATQTGTFVLHQDEDLDVVLSLANYTFSVEATPADATVVINGEERTSFTAPYGTSISWSVSKTGYTGQNGTSTLESDHVEHVSLVKQSFLFTIVPTPADATVVIDGVEQTSKTVEYGGSVSWSVSKTGYTTQSDTEVVTSAVTRNVSLVIMQFTFTIEATPVDATVIINGEERSSITADYGTTINWSVSKTGYTTQSGTETLTETYSMNVDLTVAQYTFTIEATPVDATVVINGEERTSYTAAYGTVITWSVSKSHYITQTGSYTLTGDHYETVELALDSHTFTISATPNDATVIINGEARTSITAVHGSEISWSVSRTGYVSQSGTYTLVDDHTETVTLALDSFTVTIVPTPNDATVMINGVLSNTYTGLYGSAVTWSVGKTGYTTQTGFLTLEQDTTIPVTLSLTQYTFTIDTDANNTVIINGEERTSLTADYGTEITWSVSREHYTTQTGTYTLASNHTETVTLVLANYTLTIVPTPSDATVTIDGVVRSSVSVPYGTLVDWEVSKTHYTTQSGNDVPVVADQTLNITLVPVNYTITFDVTPNDATITVNGSVLSGTAYTAAYGETVAYVIEKEGYTTVSNSVVCSGDATITVVMEEAAQYLKFNILSDGNIQINNLNSKVVYYRLNKGSWTQYSTAISVENGDEIEWKADLRSCGFTFAGTADFNVSGCITSLIDSENFDQVTESDVDASTFKDMFKQNTHVLDVSGLILPDFTVTSIYENFCYGCSNLAGIAPTLPAKYLHGSCYRAMFSGTKIESVTILGKYFINGGYQLFDFTYQDNYLSYAKCLVESKFGDSKTQYAFYQSSANTTFVGSSIHPNYNRGYSGVPNSFTIQYEAVDYLTFDILEDGNITLNQVSGSVTLQYSKNDGETWYTAVGGDNIPVTQGDKLIWKGEGNSVTGIYFSSDCDFSISGEIWSLMGDNYKYDSNNYGTLFQNCTHLKDSNKALQLRSYDTSTHVFKQMFVGCSGIVDPNIEFVPSRDNANIGGIYERLFKDCTSLQRVSSWNIMGIYLLMGVFEGCTALVDAPALPTYGTMVYQTFEYMFKGCTSLTTTPVLPSVAPNLYSHQYMFNGCTSLTTVRGTFNSSVANFCYRDMFNGCTSLTTVPALPATALADNCYQEMFKGCTSLTTAPSLANVVSFATNSCMDMFRDCATLTSATLPTNIVLSATSELNSMFRGCSNLTTVNGMTTLTADGANNCSDMFHGSGLIDMSGKTLCLGDNSSIQNSVFSSMFYGCNSLTKSPVLKFVNPTNSACNAMFYGCSSLNEIECLSMNNDASVFGGWVINVAATGTFKKNSAMTGWTTGTSGIPSGWTVVDSAITTPLITFNVTPGYDKIIVNGVDLDGNTIYVMSGSNIAYEVQKEGYEIYFGTLNNVQSNQTVNVTMVTDAGESEYLTFIARETGKIYMKVNGSIPDRMFEYSKDGGTTWNYIEAANNKYVSVNAGDKVIWRGTQESTAVSGGSVVFAPTSTMSDQVTFYVYGPVTSLVNELNRDQLVPYAFAHLFDGANGLRNHPYHDIKLPSRYLANNCYEYMFYSCGYLTRIPELLAQTLMSACYSNMFWGAGRQIRNNSDKFHEIKCLATNPGISYTNNWLGNVNTYNLTFIAATGHENEWPAANNGIPYNATVVTESAYTPADYTITFDITPSDTTLYVNCEENNGSTYTAYEGQTIMWRVEKEGYFPVGGCFVCSGNRTIGVATMDVDAGGDELRFDILGNCVFEISSGMSGNLYYKVNDGSWTVFSSSNNHTVMWDANDVVRFKADHSNGWRGNPFTTHGIFKMSGYLASILDSTNYKTIASVPNGAFREIFNKCVYWCIDASGLIFPDVTAANMCSWMWEGASHMKKGPAELPAPVAAGDYCYEGMFYNCTALQESPIIRATTYGSGNGIFNRMFDGCNSLNKITCLIESPSSSMHSSWVRSVAANGTFVKNANATWATGGSSIPSGWTIQDYSS